MIDFDALCGEAGDLVALFGARQKMVATAESCTGGLVAALITEIAGSSAVFDRGFVTYSNEAKIEILGVNPALIETEGSASEAVAVAMAQGALARSRADITVAITGIAGPGGGSADKPVGLVHFAAADLSGAVNTRAVTFPDEGRRAIRFASVSQAYAMLRELAGG